MELFIQTEEGFKPAPSNVIVETAADIYKARFYASQRELHSSGAIKEYLKLRLGTQDREFFYCMFMSNGCLIADEVLFMGTVSTQRIYLRVIIQRCLAHNATGLFIAHNHPGIDGGSQPSEADIEMVKVLKPWCREFDIHLLDSYIIGEEVFSFAEAGLI